MGLNILIGQKLSISTNIQYSLIINHFYSFTPLPSGELILSDQTISNNILHKVAYPSYKLNYRLGHNYEISVLFQTLKNKIGYNPMTVSLRLLDQFEPVFYQEKLKYMEWGLLLQKQIISKKILINLVSGGVYNRLTFHGSFSEIESGTIKKQINGGTASFQYKFLKPNIYPISFSFLAAMDFKYSLKGNLFLAAAVQYQKGLTEHFLLEGEKIVKRDDFTGGGDKKIIFMTTNGTRGSISLGLRYQFQKQTR